MTEISSRPDLTESIAEFKAEDLRTDLMSQLVMEQLKDSSGKVYRINAEFLQKDETPTIYKFYFKRDTLQFAKIIMLDKTGRDTTMNSGYYYNGSQLLKQTDKKEDNMDAETVRQLSEFYLVFSKETSE